MRAKGDRAETAIKDKVGVFVGPNPFNPLTKIELYLPKASSGTVKVFDIRGRLVVELYRGDFAEGQTTFVWQGRDAHGRTQASGAYYVKVDAGDSSWTKKLLLIK